MIFKIPHLISFISSKMRLEPGDMILTGTPAGVGELKKGDTIVAKLSHDFCQMKFHCVDSSSLYEKTRWFQNHTGNPNAVLK